MIDRTPLLRRGEDPGLRPDEIIRFGPKTKPGQKTLAGQSAAAPTHNDMLLYRDAQEARREDVYRALIRDTVLAVLALIAGIVITVAWAGNGIGAGQAFFQIFLMIIAAISFLGWQYRMAGSRVKQAVYRPLAAAFDLVYGRRVPGRRLLLPQFQLLGCLPRGRVLWTGHWFSGWLYGVQGQVFEAAIWEWDEHANRPKRLFQGVCARFELKRPFKGSLRLYADGQEAKVAEGSDLTLARRLLDPSVSEALRALAKHHDRAQIVLRDGLVFITLDQQAPWYDWPGLFDVEDGIDHIKRTARDIELTWGLAAAIDTGWSQGH